MSFREAPASSQEPLVPGVSPRLQELRVIVDKSVPPIELWLLSSNIHQDLAAFVKRDLFILYFFSGLASQADAVQARSFRDSSLEWATLDCRVLGISAQSQDSLKEGGGTAELPLGSSQRLLAQACQ
jgi:hypothetical protein